MLQKVRKAVIPAAGYGTRFLPATKATPKEMLPIVDKPTIQYIVEEALASGIEEILIISGHAKRAIEDHFDSAPALEMELKRKGKDALLQMVRETAAIKIHYIRQREMKGLGDAILCAKAFMGGEPFAVLLGDDVVYNEPGRPALRQLIDVYEATGGSVLGCQTVPQEKVSSYGIVDGAATEDERMLKVLDRYGGEADCGRSSQPYGGIGALCDYAADFLHFRKYPAGQGRRDSAYRCPAGAGTSRTGVCL